MFRAAFFTRPFAAATAVAAFAALAVSQAPAADWYLLVSTVH